MLLSLNVCLIQKYCLKILVEKKFIQKVLFQPLRGRFFFKKIFRLTAGNKYFIFLLNGIIFKCLVNIIREKIVLKKFDFTR